MKTMLSVGVLAVSTVASAQTMPTNTELTRMELDTRRLVLDVSNFLFEGTPSTQNCDAIRAKLRTGIDTQRAFTERISSYLDKSGDNTNRSTTSFTANIEFFTALRMANVAVGHFCRTPVGDYSNIFADLYIELADSKATTGRLFLAQALR